MDFIDERRSKTALQTGTRSPPFFSREHLTRPNPRSAAARKKAREAMRLTVTLTETALLCGTFRFSCARQSMVSATNVVIDLEQSIVRLGVILVSVPLSPLSDFRATQQDGMSFILAWTSLTSVRC